MWRCRVFKGRLASVGYGHSLCLLSVVLCRRSPGSIGCGRRDCQNYCHPRARASLIGSLGSARQDAGARGLPPRRGPALFSTVLVAPTEPGCLRTASGSIGSSGPAVSRREWRRGPRDVDVYWCVSVNEKAEADDYLQGARGRLQALQAEDGIRGGLLPPRAGIHRRVGKSRRKRARHSSLPPWNR